MSVRPRLGVQLVRWAFILSGRADCAFARKTATEARQRAHLVGGVGSGGRRLADGRGTGVGGRTAAAFSTSSSAVDNYMVCFFVTSLSQDTRGPAMASSAHARCEKAACQAIVFSICSQFRGAESILPTEPVMVDQIVITEKSSQAKDVRAAVGVLVTRNPSSRGHPIRPARAGRCRVGVEALVADPAAARRSYGTRPAEGGNKAAKLRAIREALRSAKRVWLATDCDREGQLIGQEILEHYEYRGQVMRVLFTARNCRSSATHSVGQNQMPNMRAFTPPPSRQADQIYNLS